MIGCKKCGNCCRYLVMDISAFDGDMQWLVIRKGKRFGDWALLPMVCPLLRNSGCSIQNHKPRYCKEFPGKFEGQEWLKALGCRYFED
jgi:Fe-S-cluster containining protein